MRSRTLAGKRVVVWGAGEEGKAALACAAESGAESITCIDESAQAETGASTSLPAEALTPGSVDVLVLSPGVSRYRPEVLAAEEAGVVVTNGTALFLEEHGDRTIAVTGSKGKSTTTLLVLCLLRSFGAEAVAGGNLGQPLLSLPDGDEWVVAEISSYQAALTDGGARAAVLTSLFPDHLPWHGSVERYYADKARILGASCGTRLVNGSDAGVREALSRSLVRDVRTYGTPGSAVSVAGMTVRAGGALVLDLRTSPLLGEHNAVNAAGAISVLAALGYDLTEHGERLQQAIETFEPLPHRLETVAERDGVTFVDDALATTPQATVLACRAFPGRPLVLLVGGLDRGVEYAHLQEYLERRSEETPLLVLAVGDAGRRIVSPLERVRWEECRDLPEAALRGAEEAVGMGEGTVVLFSPAAASDPPYSSYAQRSAAFVASIG